MLILLAGLISLILMIIPFIFINCRIKTLSRISFLVIFLLLFPHIFLHQPFFPLQMMEKELFSLPDSISLSAIALFPLAIMSTILLYNHEIRLSSYIRNISVFLFFVLINDFIKVFYLVGKFIDYTISYS